MLTKKNLLALAIMTLALPVMAAPIFLDFENVPANPSAVGKTYEVSKGVTFSDNAWSSVGFYNRDETDFPGNFFRASDRTRGAVSLSLDPFGSGGGPTTGSFTINVAAGFQSSFAMLYTAAQDAGNEGFVALYSELDGTGDRLGFDGTGDRLGLDGEPSAISALSLTGGALIPQPVCAVAPDFYCNWTALSLDFTGTAKSVVVSGSFGKYFFDNMAFGEGDAGTVPEPGSVALSLAALGALAWTRKRIAKR